MKRLPLCSLGVLLTLGFTGSAHATGWFTISNNSLGKCKARPRPAPGTLRNHTVLPGRGLHGVVVIEGPVIRAADYVPTGFTSALGGLKGINRKGIRDASGNLANGHIVLSHLEDSGQMYKMILRVKEGYGQLALIRPSGGATFAEALKARRTEAIEKARAPERKATKLPAFLRRVVVAGAGDSKQRETTHLRGVLAATGHKVLGRSNVLGNKNVTAEQVLDAEHMAALQALDPKSVSAFLAEVRDSLAMLARGDQVADSSSKLKPGQLRFEPAVMVKATHIY